MKKFLVVLAVLVLASVSVFAQLNKSADVGLSITSQTTIGILKESVALGDSWEGKEYKYNEVNTITGGSFVFYPTVKTNKASALTVTVVLPDFLALDGNTQEQDGNKKIAVTNENKTISISDTATGNRIINQEITLTLEDYSNKAAGAYKGTITLTVTGE